MVVVMAAAAASRLVWSCRVSVPVGRIQPNKMRRTKKMYQYSFLLLLVSAFSRLGHGLGPRGGESKHRLAR